MTTAFLGLGSNLGDRRANLEAAIEALDWGDTRVHARSIIYDTDPVGGPDDQPAFLNMVITVGTTLSARGLLERVVGVEVALGRDRFNEVRWGPRTIDIDILTFGATVIDEPDLQIPHPRIAERAFVLVPLAEVAPDLDIPGLGRVDELVERVARAGVRPV